MLLTIGLLYACFIMLGYVLSLPLSLAFLWLLSWSFSKRKQKNVHATLKLSHIYRNQDKETSNVISSQFCFTIDLNYSSDFLTTPIVFSILNPYKMTHVTLCAFFLKSGFSQSGKCFWYCIIHIVALKQSKVEKNN